MTERLVLAGAFLLAASMSACSPEATAPTDATGPQVSASNSPAPQFDAAAYRGAAIAGQVCGQCHDISAGATPSQTFSAPSFVSVANRPDMTLGKLEQWLTSSHPSMPNYIFNETTVRDLAAYVMSLRQPS